MGALRRFAESLARNVREDGMAGALRTGTAVRDRVDRWRNVTFGTNIYEREWDVLVLLDCARVDMVRAVADDFPFLRPVGTHRTQGTNSAEWMEVTFVDEYEAAMRRTAHLTANPNSAEHIDGSRFARFEEVWRYGWDPDLGTVPAETVTDAAIAMWRDDTPDRLIVHYMQPHPPFVPRPDIDAIDVDVPGAERGGMNVRELHEDAGYPIDELREAHLENLRYALEHVEVLRSNVDADRFVVSADHGQALGERGVLGHPAGSTLDVVRQVPWCVTDAVDAGEYEPAVEPERRDRTAESVEEKLRDLGYR